MQGLGFLSEQQQSFCGVQAEQQQQSLVSRNFLQPEVKSKYSITAETEQLEVFQLYEGSL
jgi:hypothetical protein